MLSETPGAVIVKASDKDAIEQHGRGCSRMWEAPVEAGQMLGKVTVRVGESVLLRRQPRRGGGRGTDDLRQRAQGTALPAGRNVRGFDRPRPTWIIFGIFINPA